MPSKNGDGGIQSGSNYNNIHLVILKSFVLSLAQGNHSKQLPTFFQS
jgi:hypothetical protein